jgi:hypothetical protein
MLKIRWVGPPLPIRENFFHASDANPMKISRTNLVVACALCGMFLINSPIALAQSGAKISGGLFDESHRVIEGAAVRLFSPDRLRATKSDNDGQFEFVDLPPGTYELQAELSGFETKTIENIQVGDKDAGPFSMTLRTLPTDTSCADEPLPSYEETRPGRVSLVGTVSDYGGTVLAGAKVRLTNSRQTEVTNSNDRGEFSFEDIAPGKYVVSAMQSGYTQLSTISLWIMRGNLTRVTFVLLRNGYLLDCVSRPELLRLPPKNTTSTKQ